MSEIDVCKILDGHKSFGDRIYALKRMKTKDESAMQIIEALLDKCETTSLIAGDLIFEFDRKARVKHFERIKRLDISTCGVFGKNLLKLDVQENLYDGHNLFNLACPVPVPGKLDPLKPMVAGSLNYVTMYCQRLVVRDRCNTTVCSLFMSMLLDGVLCPPMTAKRLRSRLSS